jgi:hypothetical protein
MLRYIVRYKKPKKKGVYSQQEVTFLEPEGAELWQQHIIEQRCKDIEVNVQ